MADNTSLNAGTGGDVIATDDIAGVKYQRVKIVLGADGVNNGDVSSSNALPVSDNGGSLTVDGSVTVSGTVTANAGTGTQNVSVQNASIPVTGTFWQATQPVSGTVTVSQATAANLNATVTGTVTANAGTGTMNVSVQNASIPVTDNAGSLTVDNNGTFAVQASQTGTWNVGLNAGSNAIGSITNTSFAVTQATAANLNATVVGTGTFAVQADTELPAAVSLGDSTANPTAPHTGSCIEAFNGTTWDRIRTIDSMSGTGANNTTVGVLAVGTGPGYAHRYNPANLGTAANSTSVIEVEGGNTMSWGINTTTTGTFIFEASSDATNWLSVEVFDAGLDQWVTGQNQTPTAGKTYHVACGGYRQVRIRTVSTLGATVAHVVNVSNSQQLLAGIDTGPAPHNFGYTLFHKEGNYAATQTTTTLHATTSGKKFAITDITVSTDGTTAGVVTIYDAAAATAFSAGTTPSIFRSAFAPSATLKPGATKHFPVPYVSAATSNYVLVTITGITASYIQINGYEI